MKKLLGLILVCTLTFSLSACASLPFIGKKETKTQSTIQETTKSAEMLALENKAKELELKEREIALREKELNEFIKNKSEIVKAVINDETDEADTKDINKNETVEEETVKAVDNIDRTISDYAKWVNSPIEFTDIDSFTNFRIDYDLYDKLVAENPDLTFNGFKELWRDKYAAVKITKDTSDKKGKTYKVEWENNIDYKLSKLKLDFSEEDEEIEMSEDNLNLDIEEFNNMRISIPVFKKLVTLHPDITFKNYRKLWQNNHKGVSLHKDKEDEEGKTYKVEWESSVDYQ